MSTFKTGPECDRSLALSRAAFLRQRWVLCRLFEIVLHNGRAGSRNAAALAYAPRRRRPRPARFSVRHRFPNGSRSRKAHSKRPFIGLVHAIKRTTDAHKPRGIRLLVS
ncbi:hypothetical protein EVAR_20867_1 [Eumeta japonica]|uniref:Uncharacterized protein n=1 Tax=Eumeta variegata TaxID=151549 RepID=A0A4C1UWM1_EUMVA|nr:hypothetical protein EVAR_20867_1 [Eumeta japonica]